MPKYTIVIDTDSDATSEMDAEAGVQKVTADYNATLPEESTPLTVEEYLTRVLTIAVASYRVAAVKVDTDEIARKFEKASAVERQAVKDVLATVDVLSVNLERNV